MTIFKRWTTRLSSWEYWPMWLFYLPIYFYFIWLAIRARSFFFFSASNPSMDFGGMIGEKKSDIFSLIPQKYYPKTLLIESVSEKELLQMASSFGYSLIAKPDIGERGNGVEMIRSEEELSQYRRKMKVPFLLQEFVDYPVELGVFYIRNPSEEHGRITSIVKKQFLSIVGDGKSTVKELLRSQMRALLQVDFGHQRLKHLLWRIPKDGEKLVIEQIGNHCRGTKFLDATFEADERLNHAIDTLAKQIDGFYYGRFDLKCESIDDLRELKNFSIVELNGAGAEPAHIYQPGFSLLKAYRTVFNHFKWMAEVSNENRKLGTPYWTLSNGVRKLSDIRAYNEWLKGT